MDLEKFKEQYPSANVHEKTITLSESDYSQLLHDVNAAAPEKVLTFFYEGYTIEKESADTKQKS